MGIVNAQHTARHDDDEKADVHIMDTSRKPAANLWDSKRSTRQPLTMHHAFKNRPKPCCCCLIVACCVPVRDKPTFDTAQCL
ncbi:hypothetical protein S1001342_00384 [Acetobacter pasteurianus subsp. pasteurianus]|uniref:Uncharacterized protein n=1 Tax=Acetobacter pasteurianus subsp. pasteurianus TaxID=481145 RepID=A0A1Y0Y2T3_ACEPA|nr:hypothetical protein S1001342_00384 [Acetobacter pasteurianus subsp. pasteurianus]